MSSALLLVVGVGGEALDDSAQQLQQDLLLLLQAHKKLKRKMATPSTRAMILSFVHDEVLSENHRLFDFLKSIVSMHRFWIRLNWIGSSASRYKLSVKEIQEERRLRYLCFFLQMQPFNCHLQAI